MEAGHSPVLFPVTSRPLKRKTCARRGYYVIADNSYNWLKKKEVLQKVKMFNEFFGFYNLLRKQFSFCDCDCFTTPSISQ